MHGLYAPFSSLSTGRTQGALNPLPHELKLGEPLGLECLIGDRYQRRLVMAFAASGS